MAGDEQRDSNYTSVDPKQFKQFQTETTSEAKKAATPTITKAARSKVALRTPTVNCLGNEQ